MNRGRGFEKIFFRCSDDFITKKVYFSGLVRVYVGFIMLAAVECHEFFSRESLAAGSFNQLPAPLERILADA